MAPCIPRLRAVLGLHATALPPLSGTEQGQSGGKYPVRPQQRAAWPRGVVAGGPADTAPRVGLGGRQSPRARDDPSGRLGGVAGRGATPPAAPRAAAVSVSAGVHSPRGPRC